jgi:hypothetical protein
MSVSLIKSEKEKVRSERARRNFKSFIQVTKADYKFNWHHIALADKLDRFAKGEIKKLMVFMPPQHGKSELTTRRFPAYALGLDPNKKIAICSYSATIASNFNRDIQRIVDDPIYEKIFPDTSLNENSAINPSKNTFLRNSETFEIIGHTGFVKTVGVGGSLTGTPVDIGIIDDPFKDRQEAMSGTIREKVWNWFTDVFETRLHNDSQQLVIMTRWDEDDLAGRILKRDKDWEVIRFPAIKKRESPDDPREIGEVLWPEKHSLERIQRVEDTTPVTFNSLYQQEPSAPKDLLIFPEWTEIDFMPDYTQYFGGDFGYPTAICEVKWHNKNLYLNEIMYDETDPTNSMIVEEVKKHYDITRPFVWDSAEPRSIKDLKSHKMNAIEAVKGPDSISYGINTIKEFKIHVTKDSHNLKRELNHYQWMTHKGKKTDQPIDEFNHLIDSIRYVLSVYYKRKASGLNISFHR